ncbi:uncharacterized protein [Rutidosis leptorrhynchoides]|uniref:uncharacterized protein n=1 Tax=Rutidosis leptorrhynchoides TaxID=125765 RepID=UPI003A98EC09
MLRLVFGEGEANYAIITPSMDVILVKKVEKSLVFTLMGTLPHLPPVLTTHLQDASVETSEMSVDGSSYDRFSNMSIDGSGFSTPMASGEEDNMSVDGPSFASSVGSHSLRAIPMHKLTRLI